MFLPRFFAIGYRVALFTLIGVSLSVLPAAAENGEKEQKTLKFNKRLLMVSPNEGCAIGDMNRDGIMDIVAGTHWFAGPDFVPYRLRDIPEVADVYLVTNGDHLYDVDGDGWLDVVAGEWFEPEICWYRNPGEKELKRGKLWKREVLAKGAGSNESYALKDFDGDGVPEVFVNCWNGDSPVVAWKFAKTDDGKPMLKQIVIGENGGGHGFAFGDVNGDGREDVLTGGGWFERPEGEPFAQPWKLHREISRGHANCPFLVLDLSGDGRSDLIIGDSHGFGLEWWEQGEPKEDGTTTWTKHMIDDTWSQPHCLVWKDIDGDGQCELITGKRYHAHCGGDPGGNDPPVMYYYKWDASAKKFTRHTIAAPGENIGGGMQICVEDLNGDGKPDIAVGGKTGTWVLLNEGF